MKAKFVFFYRFIIAMRYQIEHMYVYSTPCLLICVGWNKS